MVVVWRSQAAGEMGRMVVVVREGRTEKLSELVGRGEWKEWGRSMEGGWGRSMEGGWGRSMEGGWGRSMGEERCVRVVFEDGAVAVVVAAAASG